MAKRTPPQFCEKVIARISEAERYPALKAQAEIVANNERAHPEWYRELGGDLGKSRKALARFSHMAAVMRDDAINASQGVTTWVEPNWELPGMLHKGIRYAQLFGLMLEWEVSPNILQLDETFAEVILEMPLEEDEPIDFLGMMPFPCFYVKVDGLHNEQDLVLGEALYGRKESRLSQAMKPETSEASDWSVVDGFFVSRTVGESERETDLLDVHVLYADGMLRNYHIPITPGTVGDVIREIKEPLREFYREVGADMERFAQGWPSRERQIVDVLKMLQYIGSMEPDIVQVYSAPRNRPEGKRGKRLVAEANVWGVGTRVGARIRLQEQQRRLSQGDGSGAKMRVHWRRAHKHHYWIGSEKDGTRKRIPKFVEAVLVNADLGDVPTTIRHVGP